MIHTKPDYFLKLAPPLLPPTKTQAGPTCEDRGPGWWCTRERGHNGQHWGQTQEDGPIHAIWGDDE